MNRTHLSLVPRHAPPPPPTKREQLMLATNAIIFVSALASLVGLIVKALP